MRFVVAVAMALMPLACLPSAQVQAPKLELPASFAGESMGPSTPLVGWREYFNDGPLLERISRSLQNNPDMEIALQRVEIARAGARRATGEILPAVSLAAGAGLRKFGVYTMDGAGNAATDITPGQRVPTHLPDFSIGLQASWEVDLWGKLRDRRDGALAAYLASVEGTRLVVSNLVQEVATAYFELVALDHTCAVLHQTVAAQAQALEIVRLQKQLGRANELAVRQFEGQLAAIRALEATSQERLQVRENEINLLLGRLPAAVHRTEDEQLQPIARVLSAGVPSDLLRNRPDIRGAELEVQAARFDLQAARAAFLPSFSISAGIGYQAFNPRYLFTTPESVAYSAFAGLLAPVVNRSGIEADFAAARAQQIQALYNYQKAILAGYVDVANSLVVAARADEIVAFRRTQRTALAEMVAASDALYRAGKATYIEVLIAQENALSAELELIDASRRQRLASVKLYKALGGGWQ